MSNVIELNRRTGRPTDYSPDFGEQILELMQQGLSLAAAAGELGIHRQRVYEWEARHADFADTVKLARVKRQAFLERRLLSATEGPIVTSSIFALKNAGPEDWREKTENVSTVKVEHTRRLDISTLSDDQLDALEEALRATVAQLGPPGKVIDHGE